MSYPSDEVGNHLFNEDLLDEKGINPWSDVLTEKQYRELFGFTKHPFTGVDYVEYYGDLFRSQGCEVEFVFANDVRAILPYTKNVLCCDIHTRRRSQRRLLAAGAEKVLLLSDRSRALSRENTTESRGKQNARAIHRRRRIQKKARRPDDTPHRAGYQRTARRIILRISKL